MKTLPKNINKIISTSYSIKQILIACDLRVHTSNYRFLYEYIKTNQIDTSHLLGSYEKGEVKNNVSKPLSYYLVLNSQISSHKLKNKLIREGIKKHICEICDLEEWRGKPTPIHLDHINGNNTDNRIENLRILCPNCHAQTETYCGKKNKVIRKPCIVCGKEKKENYRITCGHPQCIKSVGRKKKEKVNIKKGRPTVIAWPSNEELKNMLWEKSTLAVAKELNISDVAISKHCKKFGIEKPPRGYWAKKAVGKI